MTPILIIKTANGYAVMEYIGDIPHADLPSINVATVLTDSHWAHRGKSVQDILAAHFEPPMPAEDKAAA